MATIEDVDRNFIEPVTLEETKDYLGIPDKSGKDDAMINRLITAARAGLEDFLGRIIVRRRLIYRTKLIDGPYFLPPTVESVDGVLFDIYDKKINKTVTVDTLQYDYDAGEESTVYAHFPRGAKNIRIEFLAGFEDVPEAIKMAILEIVKMKYDRDSDNPFEVVRNSIQKYKVESL